jgi:hypothetical protein
MKTGEAGASQFKLTRTEIHVLDIVYGLTPILFVIGTIVWFVLFR